MPPTPKDDSPKTNPSSQEQLATTASTNPQGVVDRSRAGFSVQGLDWEDSRDDVQEPKGSGSVAKDGQLEGVTMRDNPDRPPDAGPMWIQEVEEHEQPAPAKDS